MKKLIDPKDSKMSNKNERKVSFREPVVSNIYFFEKESILRHSTHYDILGSFNQTMSKTEPSDDRNAAKQAIAMVQLSAKKIIENINLLISNLDQLKEYQINTFTEVHQAIKTEAEKALKEFKYGLKNFPESQVNEAAEQTKIELMNYQAFVVGDVYDLNLLSEKTKHNFALLNQQIYEVNFSSSKAHKFL